MKKLDEIIDYSVLIPMKKMEGEHCEILYVDFNYTPNNEQFERVDLDNPMTRNTNPGNYEQIIAPDVFAKYVELEKEIDPYDVKKDFLKNVIELCEKKEEGVLNRFAFTPEPTIDEDANIRRLIAKINMASNIIATDGRIGPANHMIISEENYYKYKLDGLIPTIEVILEDVDDICIYRSNSIDQPGLSLLHNDEKYSFVQTGFFPQRQFMKIILK